MRLIALIEADGRRVFFFPRGMGNLVPVVVAGSIPVRGRFPGPAVLVVPAPGGFGGAFFHHERSESCRR